MTPAGTVLVTLPPRQQETAVLPAVPVWVSGPPGVLGKYDVNVKPATLRVAVTGAGGGAGVEGSVGGRCDGGVRAYLDVALGGCGGGWRCTRRGAALCVLPEG